MRERGLKYGQMIRAVGYQYVAPHAGAWIEMLIRIQELPASMVAPHAGAWIEMILFPRKFVSDFVAPHAGAWIEMYLLSL